MPTSLNNTKSDRAVFKSAREHLGAKPDTLWPLILDALHEAISVHTSSSDIIWANRALCDLYGKTVSELKGMTCSQAFHEAELGSVLTSELGKGGESDSIGG